mgnify:CR=1 FL=1
MSYKLTNELSYKTLSILAKPMVVFLVPLMISGCSGSNNEIKYSYPVAAEIKRDQNFDKLFGNDKLVLKLNRNSNQEQSEVESQNNKHQQKIQTDNSVWKAAIASVAHMPIIIADSNSGLIVTDWHRIPELDNSQRQYKVSITIDNDSSGNKIAKVKIFADGNSNIPDTKLTQMAQKIESKIKQQARNMVK